MNKQSKNAADILQFAIAYPYGCGCQETPNHCGILQVTPGMMRMFWLIGGKIDPREACAELQFANKLAF